MNFTFHKEDEAIIPFDPDAPCAKIVLTIGLTTNEMMSKEYMRFSYFDPDNLNEVAIIKDILKLVKKIKENTEKEK